MKTPNRDSCGRFVKSERHGNGQFAKGWKGGPGRPRRKRADVDPVKLRSAVVALVEVLNTNPMKFAGMDRHLETLKELGVI